MNILFVSSEVVPFSKTGGLGDVASALPKALAARGHNVDIVTPLYGSVDRSRYRIEPTDTVLEVKGGSASVAVSNGPVRTFFIDQREFFGSRQGLYQEAGRDYPDNAERFAFFCRAALALGPAIGKPLDIVHLHDWPTALAAWMIRHEDEKGAWTKARTVFTVHNLAHQGLFPKDVCIRLGLPWDVFMPSAMEFYDRLSFMKAGLVFADALTTVSPTYAKEILTEAHGSGLHGILAERSANLHGILNGIDVTEWNPATDPHLAAHYSSADMSGKAACKAALQKEMGLDLKPDVALVGLVGRLVEQKGLDLIASAATDVLSCDLQLAVLGSGMNEYEQLFSRLSRQHRGRIGVRIGFDEGLAHRIEAGGDMFLMPSRFEPCGLNQMYSLRYGTPPVVRAVGGLDDTVEDFDGRGSGTGFKFAEYEPWALMGALRRGLEAYRNPAVWRQLQLTGMAKDFSWGQSAAAYESLYESLRG